LNHDFFNYKSSLQREYLGTHASVYVDCSMPKKGAVKIPFQTNRLHSALTASALLAALKIALQQSHCSSSHLRGNNHRDSAAKLRLAMSAFGTYRTAFGGIADITRMSGPDPWRT
jgi:hypothetical protein